jgi:hypothetical protein
MASEFFRMERESAPGGIFFQGGWVSKSAATGGDIEDGCNSRR